MHSIVLFHYDNVVFIDTARLHADRLRGTDEIQDKRKKQFSWEKQTNNVEVENMNSEDFLASKLKIANSVEESFSNSCQ